MPRNVEIWKWRVIWNKDQYWLSFYSVLTQYWFIRLEWFDRVKSQYVNELSSFHIATILLTNQYCIRGAVPKDLLLFFQKKDTTIKRRVGLGVVANLSAPNFLSADAISEKVWAKNQMHLLRRPLSLNVTFVCCWGCYRWKILISVPNPLFFVSACSLLLSSSFLIVAAQRPNSTNAFLMRSWSH